MLIYLQTCDILKVLGADTRKKYEQDDAAVQIAVSKVAGALGDTGRILVCESGTEWSCVS